MDPVDVCIEQAFYTGTVNLPPRAGGYILVYQRCCRNNNITSITNGSGSTYVAHIPNNWVPVNSSPRFNNRPAIFICANQYLQFNNSATDPDGDSLSYSLVDALDGASQSCPNPTPAGGGGPGCSTQASPPPYSSVTYLAPYGANNPLNNPSGSGDLTIDATTGLLTGYPNQTGSFVVAVAVSEYRNGVMIGRTIRDYQFNIVPCNIPKVNLIYQPGTYDPIKDIGVYSFDCSNDSVYFNRDSFTNPPPTNLPLRFHWDFGVNTLTNDTSNLVHPVYFYHDTGTYLVTVIVSKFKTNVGWCYDTARGYVVVFPTLHASWGFVDHCRDSAVVFIDSSYSTSSPLNYWHWDFGDGDTTNIRNPTHIYNSQANFHVSLRVQNQKGCVDTATYYVAPRALPNPNFSFGTVCIFQNTDFLYAGSGAVTNYYWDLGNGVQSTIQNPSTTYNTAGSFNVSLITVTGEGCRDTIIKPLTVHPLPTVTTSPNVTICPFDTTQLSASGGTSYMWSPGATLSDSTISNPRAFPGTASTFYYVTVTDVNGCKNNSLLWVQVYPLPLIDAGVDTSVCLSPGSFRDSVQLHATGGVSYVWSPTTGLSNPNIADPVSRPPSNTTYYVVGTDSNGCRIKDSVTVSYLDPTLDLIVDTSKPICDFDTTTLNVLRQGNSIYIWSPPGSVSDPNSNSPRFYPHVTTTYYFSVQNYCYVKKDTATIVVHPLPPLTTEHVDSTCAGDTVRLHASGADAYHWLSDPTFVSGTLQPDPLVRPVNTQTYYVTGTDTIYHCQKNDTVLVNVFPIPIPKAGPDTAFICQGQPVQLIASGGVDYLWRADSTLSSRTVSNPIATPQDTTIYYVRVFNIHQCHADTFIKINVQLPVTAVAQSPYDFCSGVTVQLHASGGFYYLWTPGRWLNDSTIANPLATPDTSVIYIVKVSNDCFYDTASVEMIVRPSPKVFAGNDTTIYRNTNALLNGVTNGSYFHWYPGLGVVDPFELTTTAAPLYTTSYYLLAKSDYGCVSIDTILITIDPYTLLLMPTAFSPNNDGVNDLFHIVRFLNIEKLTEFKVYDRWGEKIFSTDNVSDGWDGTYRGHEMPMGTYTWMIRAKTYDGDDISRSGNITLVR